MKITSLKTKYEEIIPELKNEFGCPNIMAVAKIQKVVVNVGTGKINKEAEKIEELLQIFETITGQKPVKTRGKNSSAGFKTRKGMEIGVKVTLRGARMWSFLDRLVNVAFPRTRDFQGIKISGVDDHGDFSIGLKEHLVFPEISAEKTKNLFGMQISIQTSAKTKKEGERLFQLLKFPFRKEQ
ncbi:MAG: 50S ribosomal protein L5 [Candidatus Moranbacteria bacterium]|jgi:large subunit ribosomal protein L5|nr:50S ribosomal protein L5 [Candidatus Moranbacteria bacterium]